LHFEVENSKYQPGILTVDKLEHGWKPALKLKEIWAIDSKLRGCRWRGCQQVFSMEWTR
jgi:hypothetical protein